MALTLPPNVDPGSPVTYQFLGTLIPTLNSDAIAAAGTSISDATTNSALVTVPSNIVANGVAGSVFYLHAWGITSMPASAMPTLAFNCYSGGSSGTALATMTAFTPTASLAAALFDIEAWVSLYSATTAQALVKASISSSASTAAASTYLAGNNSTTAVTVTASTSLTLNAVFGTAVGSSSFQPVGAFYSQLV